ncbi:50S ribosomal protein L13 [Candidatus Uhrbacteria bacterium]|nr:50S ribosomal protein L13 [Candidatus Uhrbacteria bacterium]
MTEQKVHTIDANDQVLGRLASRIVLILTGKSKRTYARNLVSGDEVIVKNAGKVRLSGQKETQKQYLRYSGYPGGLKSTVASKMRREQPEKMIRLAVSRMLPKNRLRKEMIARLKFE